MNDLATKHIHHIYLIRNLNSLIDVNAIRYNRDI